MILEGEPEEYPELPTTSAQTRGRRRICQYCWREDYSSVSDATDSGSITTNITDVADATNVRHQCHKIHLRLQSLQCNCVVSEPAPSAAVRKARNSLGRKKNRGEIVIEGAVNDIEQETG